MHLRSALLTFAVVALAACDNPAPDSEDINALPVAVTVSIARVTTLRPTLELMGSIMAAPENTAMVAAPVAGIVAAIPVQEGQALHAGDIIIDLDRRQAQAEVAKANAALAQARANLSLLEKGPLPAEIDAAQQDSQAAAAAAEAQQAKLEALEALHVHNEVSDVQYSAAKSTAAEAEAARNAAESRWKILAAGTRTETLEAARAQVASAASDVQMQQLNLDLSAITSPIDGILAQLPVRQGMYVEKLTPVATVLDLRYVLVRTRVPVQEVGNIRDGSDAEVYIDSFNGHAQKGIVLRTAPMADERTGDVETFIRIENSAGNLKPGLACRVRIALPPVEGAVTIPIAALSDNAGTAVVTVIRDEKAITVPVSTGQRAAGEVQILSGLKAGEQVAVDGGYALPDGTAVRIAEHAQE